jgi:hypothetical protein
MGTIDEAIARDRDPPYLVLKASLADALKQPNPRDTLLRKAFDAFDPLRTLDDWSLGWYLTGAQLTGDSERQHSAEAEQKRRRGTGKPSPDPEGVLPGTRSEIARR